MSDKETQQVTARVDKEAYEAAKKHLEHGGITREIRNTINAIAFGETTAEKEQLKQRLAQEREERSELRSQRAQVDRKLENKDRIIERIESRLDTLRDKEGEYEGALQMIESDIINEHKNVFVGHDQVKNAAEMGNCTQEDVIDDLKERNPDIPDQRFERGIGRDR